MAVYYIYGTSNSGSTFGIRGFYSPLYLTQSEANAVDTTSPPTSHAHTFEEVAGVTFYMPNSAAVHPTATDPGTAPTGQFGGETYISYTSPISEADIEPINFGVLAGDTFNSWRRKTNEVARDAILNKASVTSLDTRFTRLIDVTGGENNIMTRTSSDYITGEKQFAGLVKFTEADDSTNAIQVGENGKIYVESSEFKFTQSIDLHTASGTLKASLLDVPTGRTKYANTTYTWPTDPPIPGQILKVLDEDVLDWDFEEAVQLNVDPFLIEDPNPIGSIIQWTKASAPSKWKLCNGQALNTYTYRALHAVISNIYGGTAFLEGTTDQSGATTTFNLPNMGGRIPIGRGTGTDVNNLNSDTLPSGGFNVLGASGGEYKHTLTVDELAEHTHETDANNSNGIDGDGYFQGLGYKPRRSNPNNSNYAEIIAKPTGGDLPHNNIQPYIVLNYIIKTESSGIVVQNVTPTNGIQINGSHSQTNLLGASTDPNGLGGVNNANSITLDVDLNDFEFVNNQLKILDSLFVPNIVQSISDRRVFAAQDLPNAESATLVSALWSDANAYYAAVAAETISQTNNWSEINKYPLYASITPRRENSMFRITVNAFGGVEGDDGCGVIVSYNTGSYTSGTAPTNLAETVVGNDDGVQYYRNATFTVASTDDGSDSYTDSGHWNGLWTPSSPISAGTEVNFFLSLLGLNDNNDRMMMNSAFTGASSGHKQGVYPTNIMIEEIYTQ